MRLEFDPSRCSVFAHCRSRLPELFGEDGDGETVLLQDGIVPAGSEDAARRAVLECPSAAISERAQPTSVE